MRTRVFAVDVSPYNATWTALVDSRGTTKVAKYAPAARPMNAQTNAPSVLSETSKAATPANAVQQLISVTLTALVDTPLMQRAVICVNAPTVAVTAP
jgi:hypothetical protein